jgi:environmental stress-induced protein Ves
MRQWRVDDQPRVRWRNDGGFTREIISEPPGSAAFHWRVSVAEVEASGPFSSFDGYTRVLVLLDGNGMALHRTDTGVVTTVQPDDPLARFPGDAPIHAELLDGPTTDFNLMWRTDLLAADAHCCAGCHGFVGGMPGQVVGGYVLEGSAVVDRIRLAAGDLFASDPGEALDVQHDGRMVHFLVGPITG